MLESVTNYGPLSIIKDKKSKLSTQTALDMMIKSTRTPWPAKGALYLSRVMFETLRCQDFMGGFFFSF